MPESQPNQAARVIAVSALVVAFVLVVFTIATSGGDSGGDGDDGAGSASSGITARGERALDAGVWVVREGDTLAQISAETGIDTDELLSFNPEVDPQILVTGQRISLRPGAAGEPEEDEEEQPAQPSLDVDQSPEPSGTGVGDEGPTGTGTTDGFDSN